MSLYKCSLSALPLLLLDDELPVDEILLTLRLREDECDFDRLELELADGARFLPRLKMNKIS